MAEYMLIRTLPNGEQRTQGPFRTRRQAAMVASYVLYDNGAASKAEAQRFSASLARQDDGTTWVHMGSGYKFRIDRTA